MQGGVPPNYDMYMGMSYPQQAQHVGMEYMPGMPLMHAPPSYGMPPGHIPGLQPVAISGLPSIVIVDPEEEKKQKKELQKKEPNPANILEIWGNQDTMNLQEVLLHNIRSSGYFKDLLYVHPSPSRCNTVRPIRIELLTPPFSL